MPRILTLEIGPIATNCYIVSDDANKAFVIDPGCDYEPILEAVRDLDVTHILLTHAHFDHSGGVKALKEATGAIVVIHELEAKWLTNPNLNLSAAQFEFAPWPVTGPAPDQTVQDGDVLELLGRQVQVLFTPGHSPGHVSYLMDSALFGGDALFAGSVGRTDLPGGDSDALFRSIARKLLSLDPTTTVLPGHGPSTTIEEELRSNPFLVGL